MKTPCRIAMIGGGLMGHGIALVMARAGHQVVIVDPVQEALASVKNRIKDSLEALGTEAETTRQSLSRVSLETDLADAVQSADFVFEAAPEKLPLKREIFEAIERYAPPDAIVASNTSVIQISKITDGRSSAHRMLGTHWWNPPHLIPLVEVVKTEWVNDQAAKSMLALLEAAGKTAVIVEKDVPGFIGNRLQHALWREAVSLVENGICDARAVDTVVKASFGRRLAVLGPLENADLVGTDLTLDIHENVLFALESRPGPSPYLQQLVEDGKLGMKTGEGFRTWSSDEAETLRSHVGEYLRTIEKVLPK
ncbi:MAG: 3-hydroxyacyl-CoA dehydrogenase family protein [Hyphomicrobiaceae bacterium]